MSDDEFRCFVGGLSWSTSDRGLKEAFDKFGHLLEAKVMSYISLEILALSFCSRIMYKYIKFCGMSC